MTANIAGRIVGGVAGLGGAGLLTVGTINAQAAYDTQPMLDDDRAAIHKSLAPFEAGTATRPPTDTSAVYAELDKRDDRRRAWSTAGLTTAIAGGAAVVSGLAALLTKGRASSVIGSLGLASAAVAGVSALYGWNKYAQMNDLAGFRSAVSGVAENARQQPSDIPAVPQNDPAPTIDVPDPERGSVTTTNPRSLSTVATFAERLRIGDVSGSEDKPVAARVQRAELAAATGLMIPSTGAVDWERVAQLLDRSGDGLIDDSEAEVVTTAGHLMMYASLTHADSKDATQIAPANGQVLRAMYEGTGPGGFHTDEYRLARDLSYTAEDMLGRPAASWEEVAATLDQRVAGDLGGSTVSDD
ncbi:MAG: hypothetical protein JWN41_504 [Thermoleophilia bacterium]|nr:hypothetical protein [Thermoleophilia bacterium]